VLAEVDRLLEGNNRVANYEMDEQGIRLSQIKGAAGNKYTINMIDTYTGATQTITGGLETIAFDADRYQLSIQQDTDQQLGSDYSAFSSHFNPVHNYHGEQVQGVMELLAHQVTEAEADAQGTTYLTGTTAGGNSVEYGVAANSELATIDRALRNQGFSPEYEVAQYLIKDGKLITVEDPQGHQDLQRAIYLKDVSHNGYSVLKDNGDTGFLLENVDLYGQRTEAGNGNLGSEQARVYAGQNLSLVGIVQGQYERRDTMYAQRGQY
jgi:hypothetical protein